MDVPSFLRRDRLLLALTGGTLLAVAGYALDLGGAGAQVVVAWLAVAAVHTCLITVARSTARTPGLVPGVRRFWFAVAAGATIYLAGDLAQVVHAALDPHAPTAATGSPVQLGALSVGSALLMIALLAMPLGFSSRGVRARFWMDVATVMVAAVVVGWYLVVPGTTGSVTAAAGSVVRGPVVVLLCCFVVAKLVMSGTAPFTRRCAALGVAAAVVKSSADGLARDGLGDGRLHWYLALTITSHALLCIAIRVTQTQVKSNPAVLAPRRRRPYSLLPYGAIAVTYILLGIAVWRRDGTTVPIALGGAALSTLLVVLRQLDAFRENARLLTELDTKVHELHTTQQGLRRSLAERDTLAARLQHQAFHDGLTGLPNRSLYAERLDAALTAGGPVAVMLIDLDDFKLVNDRFGHAAGDTLLREVGRRLQTCVRPGDTVARLGGDEFAVVLTPGPGDDPRETAARIVAAVQAPVAVEGGTARVGASVGIAGVGAVPTVDGGPLAVGPASAAVGSSPAVGSLPVVGSASSVVGFASSAVDAEALLREADHAMYAVKRAGKGSFAVAGA